LGRAQTLWLNQERDWTFGSFLLDRQGIIRYVHPGGEFHDGTEGAWTATRAASGIFT